MDESRCVVTGKLPLLPKGNAWTSIHVLTSLSPPLHRLHRPVPLRPRGVAGRRFTFSHHLAATHPSRAAARPLDTNGLFSTIPKLSSPMLGSLALMDLVLSGPHPLFLEVSSRRPAPRFWGLPLNTPLLLPCFRCTISMTRSFPSWDPPLHFEPPSGYPLPS